MDLISVGPTVGPTGLNMVKHSRLIEPSNDLTALRE